MPTKLSPSIPLQTTEVVKRPKISASLACTNLHCARAATINLPLIGELAALISTESPSLFQCQKRHKGKKNGGGGQEEKSKVAIYKQCEHFIRQLPSSYLGFNGGESKRTNTFCL